MTATEEFLHLRPEFVTELGLKREGVGYAKGRIAAGDVRIEGTDAMDFGDYYAAHHSRALDLDELYAEFVAQREEQRAAEEANEHNEPEGEPK